MPGPGELPAQQPAPIIGRDAGLARLRALVDPVPQASQVLLVTGEAGMGKTVLLADAAGPGPAGGHAGAVGHRPGIGVQTRVRRAASAAAAGAASAAGLPGRQAQALLGALGLAADPVLRTRC